MLKGFHGENSQYRATASLPPSWGQPSLEEQLRNLQEAYREMSFQPPDQIDLVGGDTYVYAPRRQPMMEFCDVNTYSALTWRVVQRAQLDFDLHIHSEVLEKEITLDQDLLDAAFEMDSGGRYDWVIRPITNGWQHQGYSPSQIVHRTLTNGQYPLGLWQYAALMMAYRPQLKTADNHFLVCAADQLHIRGYCCPMFRLHHMVELGYTDLDRAVCSNGALAYLLE
jgi:hypothetical protein